MQNSYNKWHSYKISFVHWYEIVPFWVAWKIFPLLQNQLLVCVFSFHHKFFYENKLLFNGRGTIASVKSKKTSCLIAQLKKHSYEKFQWFNDVHAFLLVSAFWKQEEHKDKKQKGHHLQLHRHSKEPLQHVPSQKDSHCLLAGRSVRYLWWRLS